jgi:exopolysaccharide biosynthesis WecB/TagA/CpsF family protein
MTTRWPRVLLGGTPVDLMDEPSALDLVLASATDPLRPQLGVMSANLDHIHHFGGSASASSFRWLAEDESAGPDDGVRWVSLLDGAPLVRQARGLTDGSWPRLAGSDLIGAIVERAEADGLRIAFLGGSAETQQALAVQLQATHPSLKVVGWWAPERATITDRAASAALAAQIRETQPHILVVGLGKPRQERWIEEHGRETGARVLLAFGAVVDFLAGTVPRCPPWVSRAGLEWAWRLALEPRRLARRYLVQGPGAYLALRRSSAVVTAARSAAGPPGQFVGEGEPAEVTAVVVTYNSAGHIDALVTSLRTEAAAVRMRLVVVDNASTDATCDVVAAHRDVCLLRAPGNLGYAGGINHGLALAGTDDAILVLNPDLEVVPGVVETMLARLSHPGVGAVVPRMVDLDGTTFHSIRREPTPLTALGDALLGGHLRSRPGFLAETVYAAAPYRTAHPVDWATGAALLVHPRAAAAVGAWDEQFFLYSEETDYFRRLRDAGWQVWFEPGAAVRHERGGSGTSPELTALLEVNRVRYARKYRSRVGAAATSAAVRLGCALRRRDPGHRLASTFLARPVMWPVLPHATPADSRRGAGPSREGQQTDATTR